MNQKLTDFLAWAKLPQNITLDTSVKALLHTSTLAWNGLKKRAIDLDQLLPWIGLSLIINAIVWSILLAGFSGLTHP